MGNFRLNPFNVTDVFGGERGGGGKEKDQWHNPVYLMQFLDFDQNLHEGFGRIYFSDLAKFVLAVDMTVV